MKKFKRIWFKALGEKASGCDNESDQVAWVRTIIVTQAIITNFFIIANFLLTHIIDIN